MYWTAALEMSSWPWNSYQEERYNNRGFAIQGIMMICLSNHFLLDAAMNVQHAISRLDPRRDCRRKGEQPHGSGEAKASFCDLHGNTTYYPILPPVVFVAFVAFVALIASVGVVWLVER